jgi:hypothetical protein
LLDGLVTFFASHHATRAEKVLKKNGLQALLVPGPREISPNCGVALQFEHRYAEQVASLLASNKVQVDSIHRYVMEMKQGEAGKYRR